ncbi:MAG TPA: hypothetical protein VLK85_37180 [Ramlibacter sp.]|nr:hypothetical protein [Ramlibacter sp.]
MQLDIFDHSRDTQLRNDLADALLRQDIAAARTVSATLTQEFPSDACLAPAAILLRVLEQRTITPLASHEEAEAARRTLHEEVEPAAQHLLGRAASGPWLALLWEALAQRAAQLPFDPRHGADHAAAFWLRAGEWDRASAAVARIPSWRRIPLPLSWMAQARLRLQGLDESWDLLAELAWLSARLLDDLLQTVADPVLHRLRERFDTTFDAGAGVDDLAWFPAWLLTEKPSLAPRLARAQRCAFGPPEQALRLLVELLGLERQGRQRDLVQRRKELRDAHPALYACYLATR